MSEVSDVDRSQWLATILSHSPDVISVLDLDGTLLYSSRFVPGTDPHGLLGKPTAELLLPQYRAAWTEAIERVLATGAPEHIVVQSLRGDLWWESRLVPIQKDGTARWILTIAKDISARRHTEATLRLREQQLKLVLDAAGMGQWSWDIPTGQVYWDEAARRIFAWTGEDDTSNLDSFLGVVHDEDRDTTRAILLAAAQTGAFEELQFRVVLPGGGTRWVLAKGRVLRDDQGEPTALICGVFDVSQGKRTNLEQARAQKLEALGQLAGGIAHDFNNLLVAIIGNTSLARQPLPDADRDGLLADALLAANRAADLTKQLLIFSRQQALNAIAIDLDDALGDTMKLLLRLLPENIQIELVLHSKRLPPVARPLPRVSGDRGQIEQVIVNLCLNARDAMQRGGRLRIETDVVELDVRDCAAHPWAHPGTYVLMRVEDTGAGIPRKVLDRVFEPFFSTKPQGTGFGLATVYGVVRRHGGFVTVQSELGSGTSFSVYLPAASDEHAADGPRRAARPEGGNETLLVAEDENAVRAVCVRVLERAGYSVLTAENGQRAVEIFKARSSEISLVLLDVVMPRLGGIEALQQIRALDPSIAAALCSGYADALGEVSDLGAGVELLPKPYEPDMLLRLVRRLLDARASRT